MCRMKYLLYVVALSVGLVNSWDIAISIGNRLELYTNQTKTVIEDARFKELTALAYDAVHNMLLFVDKQNDNASIFSYHLATKKYQSLVRRPNENIQGIAFDPVKGLLFWIDTNERSIFSMPVISDSKNDTRDGNLLIKTIHKIPNDIAVDSCRGYIYWSNINVTRATIERARFDGSERQIIVNTNIFRPMRISIDQETKRLYWIDKKEGINFAVESSSLEGNNRTTLTTGTYHEPKALTIMNNSLYWVDQIYKSIWMINKHIPYSEPQKYMSFTNEVPFGIVGNYPVADQIQEAPECEAFMKIYKENSITNNSFNTPKDVGWFCLHGVKIEGELTCKCSHGYTGDRCELSVCYNYCLNGDCIVTSEGEPICSCIKGHKGTKCDIDICYSHCLNNGVCYLSADQSPTCQCPPDYEGGRCEALRVVSTEAPNADLVSEPIKDNNTPIDVECSCLHGVIIEGERACKCSPGYTGDRCELSVCHNYCLNGDCTVTSEGQPTCSCIKGHIGTKCEIDICYSHCLNNGVCFLRDDQSPTCQCPPDYEGGRCEALKAVSTEAPNADLVSEPIKDNVSQNDGLFCLHGENIEGERACKCSPGYTGDRCDLSVCHNYCLNGVCTVTSEGEPTCSCIKGHIGTKCEIDICYSHCLNNGVCYLSDDQSPTCQCPPDYEGGRCESLKTIPTEAPKAVLVSEPINDNNCSTQERPSSYLPKSKASQVADSDFVNCGHGWDTARDPIIVVLGVMCGLLCVACTVLVTRVLHLKRRPRIKKRIIVNKNVTPMTARPDQYEITVENCCNMTICETPCFEPRSTIRSTQGDAKPVNEEKKKLISNMELLEDY